MCQKGQSIKQKGEQDTHCPGMLDCYLGTVKHPVIVPLELQKELQRVLPSTIPKEMNGSTRANHCQITNLADNQLAGIQTAHCLCQVRRCLEGMMRQHATSRSLSTEHKRGDVGRQAAQLCPNKILLRPSMGSEQHSQQLFFSVFTGVPQFRLNQDT